MAKKQHTQSRRKPKAFNQSPAEKFIESELEKDLVELVNADNAVKTFITLGRITQIKDIIDEAQDSTGKEYQQIINVTFRRLR